MKKWTLSIVNQSNDSLTSVEMTPIGGQQSGGPSVGGTLAKGQTETWEFEYLGEFAGLLMYEATNGAVRVDWDLPDVAGAPMITGAADPGGPFGNDIMLTGGGTGGNDGVTFTVTPPIASAANAVQPSPSPGPTPVTVDADPSKASVLCLAASAYWNEWWSRANADPDPARATTDRAALAGAWGVSEDKLNAELKTRGMSPEMFSWRLKPEHAKAIYTFRTAIPACAGLSTQWNATSMPEPAIYTAYKVQKKALADAKADLAKTPKDEAKKATVTAAEANLKTLGDAKDAYDATGKVAAWMYGGTYPPTKDLSDYDAVINEHLAVTTSDDEKLLIKRYSNVLREFFKREGHIDSINAWDRDFTVGAGMNVTSGVGAPVLNNIPSPSGYLTPLARAAMTETLLYLRKAGFNFRSDCRTNAEVAHVEVIGGKYLGWVLTADMPTLNPGYGKEPAKVKAPGDAPTEVDAPDDPMPPKPDKTDKDAVRAYKAYRALHKPYCDYMDKKDAWDKHSADYNTYVTAKGIWDAKKAASDSCPDRPGQTVPWTYVRHCRKLIEAFIVIGNSKTLPQQCGTAATTDAIRHAFLTVNWQEYLRNQRTSFRLHKLVFSQALFTYLSHLKHFGDSYHPDDLILQALLKQYVKVTVTYTDGGQSKTTTSPVTFLAPKPGATAGSDETVVTFSGTEKIQIASPSLETDWAIARFAGCAIREKNGASGTLDSLWNDFAATDFPAENGTSVMPTDADDRKHPMRPLANVVNDLVAALPVDATITDPDAKAKDLAAKKADTEKLVRAQYLMYGNLVGLKKVDFADYKSSIGGSLSKLETPSTFSVRGQ